jgi:RHS repeat-associated protein
MNNNQVTLTYDCDGTRVAKRETTGGVTTRYLVDDLNPTGYTQVVEELIDGAVRRVYSYGGMLVSQSQLQGATWNTSFYGYDAHGNVTFLTDATGAVTDTYDYDAWGNLVGRTGTTSNNRLYTGEEVDPDLGLINLRARQYKPGTGRFLTSDPAAGDPVSPLSFNRYTYANTEPVNHSDPLGRAAGAEYGIGLGVTAALATVPVTVQLGVDGQVTTVTTGAAVALGLATTCAFYVAASGFVDSAHTLLATGLTSPPPPAPFQHCKVDQQECDRLYQEMKKFCSAPRSRSKADTCKSATEKVSNGYGCTSGREQIQQKCFFPGAPGYEAHMQQIAEAYSALRKCLELMSAKCKGG